MLEKKKQMRLKKRVGVEIMIILDLVNFNLNLERVNKLNRKSSYIL